MSVFKYDNGYPRLWVLISPIILAIVILAIVMLLEHICKYGYRDFNGDTGVSGYCYNSYNFKMKICQASDGHEIMVQEYWIMEVGDE